MENRIKEILSEKGMTAIELSNLVGISRVSLSNIINDKQEASVNTLNSIAKSLDVPFWQLFVSQQEVQPKKAGFSLTCPDCGKSINLKVE